MGFMRLTEDHELIPVLHRGEWDDRDAELRRLWTLEEDWRGRGVETLTRKEIGRRLGVTENAIIGRSSRIELPPRRKPALLDTPTHRREREYQRRKARRLKDAAANPKPESLIVVKAAPKPPAPKRLATGPRQRFSSTMPATIARASGNLSPFDGLTYRAPKPYTPPAPRTGRVIECMWIEGDSPHWRMCEAMSEPGRSFCEGHGKRAYQRAAKSDQMAMSE